MSNWAYGIIIGVLFLSGSLMVYKTLELSIMIEGMTLDVIKLELATKEFTCDVRQVHIGYNEGEDHDNDQRMQVMNDQKIKPELFSVEGILPYLLDESWHKECEIILDYMPRYPNKDTKPTVQIRHNNGTKYPAFLRYSKGPKQGFFWDVYGEDFHNPNLALIALSQAPAPRSVAPLTFTIPLNKNAERK